jgi:prepilin-type processing-associated H-X9-DG protein
MLMPALSKAREHAKKITCSGNMKQIGVALQMYLNDYNGYIVRWGQVAADNYASALAPYLNVTKKSGIAWNECGDVFKCPSAENYIYDYGTNLWSGYKNASTPFRKINEFTRLTEIVFLCDTNNVLCFNLPSAFEPRHNGRGNSVFMDGHVESKKGLGTSNLY